jgi:hypothetical protein
MRLCRLSKSSHGHFSSLLYSASPPVFLADLAYFTTLLFPSIYKKLLKTELEEKMFTKWERKGFRLNGKKPLWSETRVKPCFGQQIILVQLKSS